LASFLRGSQKFLAVYRKKHNTTTVTSVFVYIVFANFIALIPSFVLSFF